jgi:hypothetical protein
MDGTRALGDLTSLINSKASVAALKNLDYTLGARVGRRATRFQLTALELSSQEKLLQRPVQ